MSFHKEAKMLKRFMTDKQVERCYVKAGAVFGDAVSYIYMGECVGFTDLLAKWEKWEAEYAKRGYRTLPVDDFVDHGGYGMPFKDLGAKRTKGEKPVFHAKIYRELYLGKIQPAINLSELMKPTVPVRDSAEPSKPREQVGTYFVPSTKKAK